ncbi:hypothetical protein NHX12_031403 [Muraenolepis orangiensis]|uniref:Uncharacterized protein n=1 Tax=Muraenolepis orangiensis TaxID=630683 RepID=A0A9Q0E4F5_9TELE|nr:hypothetical protein NHX12_031403 [Muraenolepis orangiensis]
MPETEQSVTEPRLSAVRDNNLELLQEILRDLDPFCQRSDTAAELTGILQQPHIQSLLETHDSVASQECETPATSPCDCVDHDPPGEGHTNSLPHPPEAIRMVGIRKVAGEHLGVTFRVEAGELVIARILHGGMVDQQGLLHVGDIIKEVNGREVCQDPRVVQEELQAASGSMVLKIVPSYHETNTPNRVFFKCHYDYDPANDNLIPCKEAGLRFETGDILQIVNQDDVNWWQLLEEKRKAFVKRDAELPPTGNLCTGIGVKKKKKMMYVTTRNAEFDRHELLIYEEEEDSGSDWCPGRREAETEEQASVDGPTTIWHHHSMKPRPGERESRMFAFTSRSAMEADVKAGRYLEHGEYDGNLYGTRTASIHQSLKVLQTSEFLPYVVFLKAPEFQDAELQRTCEESTRLEAAFGHFFDLTVVNDNLDETYRTLKAALDTVSKNPQWVPVTWVF